MGLIKISFRLLPSLLYPFFGLKSLWTCYCSTNIRPSRPCSLGCGGSVQQDRLLFFSSARSAGRKRQLSWFFNTSFVSMSSDILEVVTTATMGKVGSPGQLNQLLYCFHHYNVLMALLPALEKGLCWSIQAFIPLFTVHLDLGQCSHLSG